MTDLVYTTVVVTCALSVVGASFIIVSFLLSVEFRKSQSRRLLFILSVCDLVVALAYIIFTHQAGAEQSSDDSFNNNVPTMCKAQAIVNIFANQASFFWTDFISLFLFLSRKYGVKHASKFIPLFHFISWGWPTISVGLVAYHQMWGIDKGSTANWCWIRGNMNDTLKFKWHLIAGKAVELSSCVFITVMYIFVFFDLRKKS